jgi:hypothetical protein
MTLTTIKGHTGGFWFAALLILAVKRFATACKEFDKARVAVVLCARCCLLTALFLLACCGTTTILFNLQPAFQAVGHQARVALKIRTDGFWLTTLRVYANRGVTTNRGHQHHASTARVF